MSPEAKRALSSFRIGVDIGVVLEGSEQIGWRHFLVKLPVQDCSAHYGSREWFCTDKILGPADPRCSGASSAKLKRHPRLHVLLALVLLR